MNQLIKFSLKNTVAIILLVIFVIIGGIYETKQAKVETYPNVAFPALFIQATAMNHSAEEIESQVTNPLETSIKNLGGYDTLTSTSSNNSVSIAITYPYGTDMDKEKSQLQSAIDTTNLPDGANAEVRSFSTTSQPIYEAAIAQKGLDTSLQNDIDSQLVPMLQKVEGIATVNVQGESTPQISVIVDKSKAKKNGITLEAIQQAIQSKDYKVTLGQVDNKGDKIPLEMQGTIKNLDDLKSIEISPIAGQNASSFSISPSQMKGHTGTPSLSQSTPPKKVKLSDIATIKKVNVQSQISRYNGEESYLVSVTKTQDANTDQVVKQVKDQINQFKKDHPFTLYTVQDQGKQIEDSISSLLREGGLGILFAIIIILLFLRNIRATIIAIISLPTSILATIWVLKGFGYTLNIMTLGGMAVAVGRIVDDSIVVIENIFRWRQEKDRSLTGRQIALYATKEVAGAVTSSTFATLVVFLPLALVSGIIGQLFRPFALAVVFSIFFSLVIAMLLIPVLGSLFFKKVKHIEKEGIISRYYEKILRTLLTKKAIVISISLVLLVGSLAMIPKLGIAFLPAGEGNTMSATVSLPNTVSLNQTNDLAKKIEAYFKTRDEIDYSQVSIGTSNGFRGHVSDNEISMDIQLKKGQNADNLIDDYQKGIQGITKQSYKKATVKVSASSQQAGPPSGNNIDIQLSGGDLSKQSEAANKIMAMLKQNKQLKNISSNQSDEQTKWRLVINKEGQDLGVQYPQLMQAVSEYLQTVPVGSYDINGSSSEVTLSYGQSIQSKADIDNIEVNTIKGPRKVGDIAEIMDVKTPTTLYHDDGKPLTKVSADIKGNDTAGVTKKVTQDLNGLSLPNGVDVKIGGGFADIMSGFSSLGIAMGAAVGLVFLVLSVTFGGILTPLIILSSLIFVPVGALGGLLVSGQPLSMSAMIGMLMLIGIVVTNAVVLLDRVETNRRNDMPLIEAIVEAAKRRVRPILMTALATIFALIPLAFTPANSGLLISKGLAVAVIGGLTTSTLLTLIFVPIFYSIVGKKRRNIKSDI